MVFQATFTFNSVNGKIHTDSIIEIVLYCSVVHVCHQPTNHICNTHFMCQTEVLSSLLYS